MTIFGLIKHYRTTQREDRNLCVLNTSTFYCMMEIHQTYWIRDLSGNFGVMWNRKYVSRVGNPKILEIWRKEYEKPCPKSRKKFEKSLWRVTPKRMAKSRQRWRLFQYLTSRNKCSMIKYQLGVTKRISEVINTE